MPKPEPPADPDVQLQIRLPRRLHDRLWRKAHSERRSLAAVARQAIEAHLKPAKREPATP